MTATFASAAQFREIMDKTFQIMSDDPEIGPRLRDADTPQRFDFTDLDLIFSIRAGDPEAGEENLVWAWAEDVDWESKVQMAMASDTANRYFQGKENLAIAIARRRITATGDVRAALGLLPILKPLFARYRQLVVAEYPALEV